MNRPTALLLVSRRHVDLLRVCAAACPAADLPRPLAHPYSFHRDASDMPARHGS